MTCSRRRMSSGRKSRVPLGGFVDADMADLKACAANGSVHVVADDRAHPDAALVADFDVADHLRGVVDEDAGRNAGKTPAMGTDHGSGLLQNGRMAERQD